MDQGSNCSDLKGGQQSSDAKNACCIDHADYKVRVSDVKRRRHGLDVKIILTKKLVLMHVE